MRVSVPLAQGSVCLHLHLGLVSSWLPGEAEELIKLLLTLEMEASSFSAGLCPVLLKTPLKSAGWGGFTEHRILEWPGRDLKNTTTLLFFFLNFFFYFDCLEFEPHSAAICTLYQRELCAQGFWQKPAPMFHKITSQSFSAACHFPVLFNSCNCLHTKP